MEMTKVVKPFSRRVWPNTFGNRVCVCVCVCVLFLEYIFLFLFLKTMGVINELKLLI